MGVLFVDFSFVGMALGVYVSLECALGGVGSRIGVVVVQVGCELMVLSYGVGLGSISVEDINNLVQDIRDKASVRFHGD